MQYDASINLPSGSETAAVTISPWSAAANDSTVPSPPSATGTVIISASGRRPFRTSDIVVATSFDVRHPLNESGAIRIFIFRFIQRYLLHISLTIIFTFKPNTNVYKRIETIINVINGMKKFNVGIIGAGWIAQKMAETLSGLPQMEKWAIASRDIEKAKSFAAKNGFVKSYGSYKELVDDPEVDLVYIATPHSHHFAHASLAIEAGKPVLCEKAFTANAKEADALLNLAHKKGVFITEAIWTRFMPLYIKVKEMIDSGMIGEPKQLSASLCYNMIDKERILRPDLCGGALLDLGVYTIHFARMYFGSDIERVTSSAKLFPTGTDAYNSIQFYYRDGRIANLQSSALTRCNREGLIAGSDGFIEVDNVNCTEAVRLYDSDYNLKEEYFPTKEQINGYEYQVIASRDAILQGKLETPFISHEETLAVMKQMDELRMQWGVRFPMDCW